MDILIIKGNQAPGHIDIPDKEIFVTSSPGPQKVMGN